MWVDASTSWGIGIIVAGAWDAWRLRSGWTGHGRDIGWAEMIAVELAARYLESVGHSNCNLLIRSDNQGVVLSYTRGRSRNLQVNDAIARVGVIAMAANIQFILQYVPTDENKADPLSRGHLGQADQRLPATFDLPEVLVPYLLYA